MKFKSILICSCALAIGFVSCKKDSGSDNNKGNNPDTKAFEGTWTFAGMHSSTVAQNVYSEAGDDSKTITNSVYLTKNNTGTIKFENGTATSTGVGYSVDTTLTGYFYDNNVLTDSLTSPFVVTVPPANSTSGYKLVGADSISFTGSGLVNAGSTTGAASGGHYSITDGKMTISTSVVKDSVAHDGDATLTIHESADLLIYLQK